MINPIDSLRHQISAAKLQIEKTQAELSRLVESQLKSDELQKVLTQSKDVLNQIHTENKPFEVPINRLADRVAEIKAQYENLEPLATQEDLKKLKRLVVVCIVFLFTHGHRYTHYYNSQMVVLNSSPVANVKQQDCDWFRDLLAGEFTNPNLNLHREYLHSIFGKQWPKSK